MALPVAITSAQDEYPAPPLHIALPLSSGEIRSSKLPNSVPERPTLSDVFFDTVCGGGTDDRNTKPNDRLKKIPKPKGEFGKPNCGGYNIKDAANWDDDTYMAIREWVNGRVDNNLDLLATFSQQNPAIIDRLRADAVKQYPVLENYEDYWPVDDLIRAHIKYKRRKAEGRNNA